MKSFALRRVVVGTLLLSSSFAFAYDDDSFDSYNYEQEYDQNRSNRDSYSQRPYDSQERRSPSSRERSPSLAQSQTGYGPPFGVSKSTAGAIAGALLGAGSGAIIGSHKGKAGPGAAIGAGVGALAGYLTGRQIEARDQALDEQDRLIEQQRQELAKNRQLLEELKRHKLDVRETSRGVVVNLPDVLFEFNSARLTANAQEKVFHIASVLQKQANDRRVAVEGHTDSIGSESYNQALSQRRAQTVVAVLSSDGVRESRLSSRGFGERYPVAPNTHADGTDDPNGRAKNRRVEVIIKN
jgi:outer membrane protein OmpA-like peptidoglycan-associated protein